MAKTRGAAKKATNKNEEKKNKNKKVDQEDNEEEQESFDNEEEQQEIKSTLLTDCNKIFGMSNLYQVLDLDKENATATDIKKAYYKLSLKCHPDKVTDESKKEESTIKFQTLGKIYSILSDEEKKKLYDETGEIEGEDELFSSSKQCDWDEYWRAMFKKVTKDDIKKFFDKYKDSEEERNDLIKYYERFKGDFDMILMYMYSIDSTTDESRFKDILIDLIDQGKINKYDCFVNENKRKAHKRKVNNEKEAKEAEKLKKELGIDESQESLRDMILSRRKNANEQFLDNLAKKYAESESDKKKLKTTATKSSSKKKQNKADSLKENESDQQESSSENDDSDDDACESKKSKKNVITKKATASKAGKKVKRL